VTGDYTTEDRAAVERFKAIVRDKDSALSLELATAAANMRSAHYSRLSALGVDWGDLIITGSIGLLHCRVEKDLFEPAEEGEAHLIVPVMEGGFVVDLVAFRPKSPDTWALRTGLGWALGHDAIEEAISPWPGADQSLLLSPTPLEWLRAGKGACIVQWTDEATSALRLAQGIVVGDPRMAQVLRLQLSKPPALPPIAVLGERADAA
jgi:hypothetical protein